MKNKKSLLSLGLVALVLVLGVGYAVVSSVGLTFGGSANVADATLRVDIASVADVKTNATVTHTLGTSHAASDTFTITGMTLNEEVKMTYTIDSHEDDVEATIKEKVALTNSDTTHFSASYEITKATVGPVSGEATVVVTVKMIKTPVSTIEPASFSLQIEATPVQ